jgi:hypothetical protein
MPNWCRTDFNVTGPAEDIIRFREAVRGSDHSGETPFDFNRVFPLPQELREIDDDGIAYKVYYGDAEPIHEYSAKRLDIETVEQLRKHLDADPKHSGPMEGEHREVRCANMV